MSQVSLVINTGIRSQMHQNGLSGTLTVPGKEKNEFGLLVVYPTVEIQDIGDNRRTTHFLKSKPIARDIVGNQSDAAAHSFGSPGSKEKWGLLLCEAEPDIPRELENAMEEEVLFLNENMPDIKMKKDPKSGALVALNIEDEKIKVRKAELSEQVQTLRAEFEKECRRLVMKTEIQRARKSYLTECQRLVAEGDKMWATGKDQVRASINELHMDACSFLGQERPWCYVPQELVDCPGCGAKIKDDILTCPQCGGWLAEGIKELRQMHTKDRAMAMYPNRYEKTPVSAEGV